MVLYESQVPARKTECLGRPIVKERGNPSNIVVSQLEMVSQIFHIWGKPHIDLFASHLNLKLPLFVSPVLDHEAYARDTLSLLAGNVGIIMCFKYFL